MMRAPLLQEWRSWRVRAGSFAICAVFLAREAGIAGIPPRRWELPGGTPPVPATVGLIRRLSWTSPAVNF